MSRGTSNSNVRGSSTDRKARKRFLLKVYAANVPNRCRCFRCGLLLDESTLTIDRIIPGAHGGKYVRNNIRPACLACNSSLGSQIRS